MARVAAGERGLVLAHPGHGAAEMEDREDGHRRGDPQPVVGHGVDHLVVQLREVAGADVVPPVVRERRVEARLMGDVRLRRAHVEQRRAELPQRLQDLLALLDRPRVAAADDHHVLAVKLRGHDGDGSTRRKVTIVVSSSGTSVIQSR